MHGRQVCQHAQLHTAQVMSLHHNASDLDTKLAAVRPTGAVYTHQLDMKKTNTPHMWHNNAMQTCNHSSSYALTVAAQHPSAALSRAAATSAPPGYTHGHPHTLWKIRMKRRRVIT